MDLLAIIYLIIDIAEIASNDQGKNMNKFKYDVSLRITHSEMDPDEICQKLNMKPTHKWCVGEQRRTPKGMPLSGIYKSSYCSFKLNNKKSLNLIDFLKHWNNKLIKYKKIFNYIYSTGGKNEYFIGWYSNENSGEVFEVSFLKELVELKINLSIDFYGG